MIEEVSAREISFSYGPRLVLQDVSLSFGKGVTGLLGPNGAGKTTLMSIIACLRRPRLGRLFIDGFDVGQNPMKARKILGYLPQSFDLLLGGSVERNVSYAAWAKGIHDCNTPKLVEKALRSVNLWDKRETKVRNLSGGMRQRLGIACAVVHQPKVLVLDEPTVGLDPVQRVVVREMIGELARDAAVLVSTHLLEDLVALTSSVVILNEGRLAFSGSLLDLEEIGQQRARPGVSAVECGYAALLEDT
ncbi:MAG: ATP-binding cassette domain-containing protein [Tessaracoccus sp.]